MYDPVKKSLPFTVLALFPNTPRWERTLPRRGQLVSMMGEIVGKKEGGDMIAVLIQSFDYIFAPAPEMATEAGVSDGQSSPQTPQKSRWDDWHSKAARGRSSKATPGRKRVSDAVDSDEDSQQPISPSPSKRRKLASTLSDTVEDGS